MREQLVALRPRLGETEHKRDGAAARAEAASAARAEAGERTRGAVSRADDEAVRAQRAVTDLAKIRDQLDQARTAHDSTRAVASSPRERLAAAIVESTRHGRMVNVSVPTHVAIGTAD
ncbi:hypothetical protein E3O06_11780 [Cryobacterium glaciale]|uniref:Uncharacterized protein n=1 Tax=Cryobacterium glaciale TaxID=1259145 RepID=A0A4R8UUH2_9MICO|nr:hypothetical protein [Cryobacterium glaciale]TFB71519.1 hypothetical protein E3O06_11780 [Cryobacterium glaciale]